MTRQTANEHHIVSEITHAALSGLNAATAGLHFVGEHVPGALHKAVAAVEVIKETFSDHTSGNFIEDTACGIEAGLAKVAVNAAPLLLPQARVPGILAKAATTLIFGAAAQQATAAVGERFGESVRKSCHQRFHPIQTYEFLRLVHQLRQPTPKRAATPRPHAKKTEPVITLPRSRTPMRPESNHTSIQKHPAIPAANYSASEITAHIEQLLQGDRAAMRRLQSIERELGDQADTVMHQFGGLRKVNAHLAKIETFSSQERHGLTQEFGRVHAELKELKNHEIIRQKKEAFAKEIQGYQAAFQFCGALGDLANSETLVKASQLGLAGVSMYGAGMELAAGGFALGPAAAIGIAGLSVVSTFLKKKNKSSGSDPLAQFAQAIFQGLSIISKQIADVRYDIAELRRENMENFYHLMNAITTGFEKLEIAVRDEIRNFRIPAMAALQRIEDNLNHWGITLLGGQKQIALQPFYALRDRMSDWDNGRETDNPKSKIPKIANQAANWLTQNLLAPAHTGMDLWEHATTNRHYNEVVFPDLSRNAIAQKRGFLAHYYLEYYPTVAKNLTDHQMHPMHQIVNLALWIPMAHQYAQFRQEFGEHVLDPNGENIDKIIDIAKTNFAYLQSLRSDHAFFDYLFECYLAALKSVSRIMIEEVAAKNNALNNAVDISKTIARMMRATSGSPINQVVKGGTTYTDYAAWHEDRLRALGIMPLSQVCGGQMKARRADHIKVLSGHSQAHALITKSTSTTSDLVYDDCLLPHQFPVEFLLLEKLDLASISCSYVVPDKALTQSDWFHIVNENKKPSRERCITVTLTYSSGLKRQIAEFNQVVTDGKVTSQTESFEPACRGEASEHLENHILSLRKKAIQNALTRMEPYLQRLDAFRRLLIAYAIDIGLQDAARKQWLDQLINASPIADSLKTYLSNGTINTPFPLISFDLDFDRNLFNQALQPQNFENDWENALTDIVVQLELIKFQDSASELAGHRKVSEPESHSSREREEVLHQSGFEFGQAMGLAVICEKLRHEKFETAARILAPKSDSAFSVDAGKLSAAERHGFLLGVSTQITAAMTRLTKPDVIPQLIAANELTAISWLGEFSQQQIAKSLEASRVSNALLLDAKKPSGAQTVGLFSASQDDGEQTDSEDLNRLNSATRAFCVTSAGGGAYGSLWQKPANARSGVRELRRSALSGNSARFGHQLRENRGEQAVTITQDKITVQLRTTK